MYIYNNLGIEKYESLFTIEGNIFLLCILNC